MLDDLGYVRQVPASDHNEALVEDYLLAAGSRKPGQELKDRVLVVAPTHKEGDAITAAIRARLKTEGKLGPEERRFAQLVPLHWTDAEKGDQERYSGAEVVQFFRTSGPFKAGSRPAVATLLKQGINRPQHFAVYAPREIRLAAGDALRATANGWATDAKGQKHRVNNGACYTVRGFTAAGDIALTNGWTLAKDFGHVTHGYVTTSHAAQGKTVDRVLIAMGRESEPAINAEQFYVSVSRGRERATIYTDLSPQALRAAIRKKDPRKSATELLRPRRGGLRDYWERSRHLYRRLRERVRAAMTLQPEREVAFGR